MRRFIFLIMLIANGFVLKANVDVPAIPKSAPTVKDFVPAGWKILFKTDGDLNQDAKSDVALIIQDTNLKNIVKNGEMGDSILNINPRMLIVLLKQKDNSYVLAGKNTTIIPTEGSLDQSCLADPVHNQSIQITNGVLKLKMQYWSSCGSYGVTNFAYIFRFQNQKFDLIGFDNEEFSRLNPENGNGKNTSINFSTFLKKTITNNGEADTKQLKVTWNKIPKKRFNMEEIAPESLEKLIGDSQI